MPSANPQAVDSRISRLRARRQSAMRRTSILALACLLALSFVLGQLLARPTSGQAEAPPPRQVGRYQLALTVGGMAVVDTTTGHCWVNLDKEKWEDVGSPLDPKKP
jgi:hypothetical protein